MLLEEEDIKIIKKISNYIEQFSSFNDINQNLDKLKNSNKQKITII